MRVAVCNTLVPFVRGGAESHAVELVAALERRGHEAELVTIPFRAASPEEVVKQMLAWRLVDFREAGGKRIDRLIALRFPSYFAQHPSKVVWLIHQHRALYELWGTSYQELDGARGGERVREIVRDADRAAFGEAMWLFANSKTVARRLARFNDVEAKPLYHPPPDATSLRRGGFGDYVFCPSRLERIKRQALLVDAMAEVRSAARCVIAGVGPVEGELLRAIADRGLESRIELRGHVPRQEMIRLYAESRAVFFGPYEEDYGYVTLEAMLCGKPVITLVDSGGPLEFVSHGENGFVVPPDAKSIAGAIDALYEDAALAERMGSRGFEHVTRLELSWDRVVDALTAC